MTIDWGTKGVIWNMLSGYVAHYLPWLTYWWQTQKIFPISSVIAHSSDVFSSQDSQLRHKFERSDYSVLFFHSSSFPTFWTYRESYCRVLIHTGLWIIPRSRPRQMGYCGWVWSGGWESWVGLNSLTQYLSGVFNLKSESYLSLLFLVLTIMIICL